MSKKVRLKTTKNNASVPDYVASLTPAQQVEAKTLLKIFKTVTNTTPKMWGASIVGFGEYDYQRSNGDEGTFLATGFSMRKSGPTIYIMPGYSDYSDILKQIGSHKLGKSCLYLKNLDGVHIPTLKKLIKQGLQDLKKTHTLRIN